MKCPLNGTVVKVYDCERCLTQRKASPVCFRRGFVWGVPDSNEPRWVLTLEEAQNRDEDVSRYFDPEWEGNIHLPRPLAAKIKNAKMEKKTP